MRIVIAGGTGFIGGRLTDRLLGDGHEVVVLTRSAGRASDRPGLSYAVWDGRTAEDDWVKAVDGAGAVVNLAGAPLDEAQWTAARKRLILESRVNAGQALTAAVQAASVRPEVFVQGSAVGWYGKRDGTPVDEAAPAGKGFLAEVCRAWEPSSEAVEGLGVRRVIVRTGIVLGAGGGVLARVLTPFKFFVGGPLGSGKQGFSWVHLDDEVDAIRYLLRTPSASGPYNLTAPNPVANADFAHALGHALGRPSSLPAPGFALRLMFGEMAEEMLLAGQFVLPRRLLEAGYVFRFPGLAGALEDITADL